jgi:hypothetical protein
MSNRAWFMAGLATAAPLVLLGTITAHIINRRQYATPLGARNGTQ